MSLVPPCISSLRPYNPGPDLKELQRRYGIADFVQLASNENPLGCSALAMEALTSAARGVHRYPGTASELRAALAEKFQVKVSNVAVGNGSEGILSNIIRAFLCDHDEVLTTEAAFVGFQAIAQSRGTPYRTVPYRNWAYDLDALARDITERTKIIYLANPNNPTGTIFTREEFETFYRRVPRRVLILLDEAYFEYARPSPDYPDSMHYRHDNVITLRTFSKAYGLAGLRVGYGFAHEDLIANMLKVKLTYELNTMAIAAALGALADPEFVEQSVQLNGQGRKFLTESLREIGLTVVPSGANFVMIPLADETEAARITLGMLEQGVLIRQLTGFGLPQCVRITTGTSAQNARCAGAMHKIVGARV
jgi:histidinol-phosphate aminotransferase